MSLSEHIIYFFKQILLKINANTVLLFCFAEPQKKNFKKYTKKIYLVYDTIILLISIYHNPNYNFDPRPLAID